MPRTLHTKLHDDSSIEIRLVDRPEDQDAVRTIKISQEGMIEILDYAETHDPAPRLTIAIGDYDGTTPDMMIDGIVNFTDNI